MRTTSRIESRPSVPARRAVGGYRSSLSQAADIIGGVPVIELTRSDALDVYAALLHAEDVARAHGETELSFALDGAVRILFLELFAELPPGAEEG